MRLFWIWVGPISNDKYSYKKREGERAHRGSGHVKTEAKIGVVLAGTKEHLGPPEAENGKKRFIPRTFRESTVLLTH